MLSSSGTMSVEKLLQVASRLRDDVDVIGRELTNQGTVDYVTIPFHMHGTFTRGTLRSLGTWGQVQS